MWWRHWESRDEQEGSGGFGGLLGEGKRKEKSVRKQNGCRFDLMEMKLEIKCWERRAHGSLACDDILGNRDRIYSIILRNGGYRIHNSTTKICCHFIQ